MHTNAPNFILWIVAVGIAALGILAKFVVIPVISVYAFWVVVIAFVVLALATVLKGV